MSTSVSPSQSYNRPWAAGLAEQCAPQGLPPFAALASETLAEVLGGVLQLPSLLALPLATSSSHPAYSVVVAFVSVAALAPIVLIGVAFVVYCLVDVARAPSVRYLPKWAWALICLASIPLGGIVYLVVGRGDRV